MNPWTKPFHLVALIGVCLLTPAGPMVAAERVTPSHHASPTLHALANASQEDQYTFVFFWKKNDTHTTQMQQVFTIATRDMGGAVKAVSVSVTDPREQATVEHFGVQRAPMPLVVAVAPNGAVTKAWPLRFTAEQLREGIVSHGTAACLKAMQDRKLIVLCVQGKHTAYNVEAQQAVAAFKNDERFAAATEVIQLNPANAEETSFLKALKVTADTSDAVTLLLSSAGQPIGRFDGAVTTSDIIAKVTSAQSGCCPGGKCGPGGCCPGGKCKPSK